MLSPPPRSTPAADPAAEPVPSTDLGALREVPYMGVIFVVAEAMKLGYENGHPDWCNLGQGQPEVGPMAGAPARISSVAIDPDDHAYGPLEGTPDLRAVVAEYYNRLHRRGKASQYTAANVAIAGGGRLALTRAMAALGQISIGYQLPDYTAFEDMFNLHLDRIIPEPIRSRESDGFGVSVARLREEIADRGLSAYLFSNPCNPTGNVIEGAELAELVELCRASGTTLLSDEFYSHFIYTLPEPGEDCRPAAGPVSTAAYVEDVERDPILIFDGLTKNHRYPGWRVGWVVGPSHMIETMARTGSSIDGGPSRLAQAAALRALEPARAEQETRALREVFCAKRNVMVRRLAAMGVRFANSSRSTFYCWGSLDALPPPFDDGMTFFRRALERKVLTVPGKFFDVNPGKRRQRESPYRRWMRFSFGPPMENMVLGLDRLEGMLAGVGAE